MAIYTDNFDRADGALGANWTNINGVFSIVTNKAKVSTAGTGSYSNSVYSAGALGADQYAQVVLQVVTSMGGAVVRGSNSVNTCYYAVGNSSSTYLFKFVNGAGPTTIANNAITWAVGNILRLEVRGTVLTVYKNGTAVLTGTDGAIASGYAGIAGLTVNAIVDTFEGGDLAPLNLHKPAFMSLFGWPGAHEFK